MLFRSFITHHHNSIHRQHGSSIKITVHSSQSFFHRAYNRSPIKITVHSQSFHRTHYASSLEFANYSQSFDCSDLGGFLDIVLDFVFYGAIPLAFVILDPAANATK